MDLSGAQGELPVPLAMHGGGGGSPYLGMHHGHYEHPQQHSHGANGRHMSPPEAVVPEEAKSRQLAVVPVGAGGGAGGVRYRECLKNHAAAIGGSATDGCGEFMPAGEEGSLDALRCSACGCHRNFHRKEPPGGDPRQLHHHHHHHHPLSPLAAAHHHHHHRGLLVAALPPAPTRMVMPLSAMQHHSAASADSDDARAPGQQQQGPAAARKRFRTKFTAEQKARMLGFAEEAGWRLQKLDDAEVQRFCQEVGVKRRVLKVWMHNNKHTLARRGLPDGGDPEQQLEGMPLPEPVGPGRSPSRSPPPPPQHQQLRLE
jgi:ZF-HD class homeobox domain-containing protein